MISPHWISAILLAAPVLVSAQAPAAPVTAVLVDLTIRPGADRAQIGKTMADEVRETLKAYLDGKIQQWYARADGRGVVFILNAASVADARAVMDSLPLAKAGLVNLEFTALGPLTPLRRLIESQP